MGTAGLALVCVASVALIGTVTLALIARRGARWGSTAQEREAVMPGDTFLTGGGPALRLRMTRAISVPAPPQEVWPFLAQIGRGAGWYSLDRLDNGGRESAWHLVSWIPEPALGDASAIGYLSLLEPGRRLVWWTPQDRWLRCTVRMVMDIQLDAEAGQGSRVVVRVSSDARGALAQPVGWMFQLIDSIMSRRQLIGLRDRVLARGDRLEEAGRRETGARDQYQLYEVIYASGERAGVAGQEHAARWRERAREDGVLGATSPPGSPRDAPVRLPGRDQR